MRKAATGLLLLFLTVLLTCLLDRALARGDLVRLQKERERLMEVRDAVVRYAVDHRRLPEDLRELVPRYLPESMTVFRPDARSDRAEAILWDPEKRTLAWPAPFVVSGVFTRGESFGLSIGSDLDLWDPGPLHADARRTDTTLPSGPLRSTRQVALGPDDIAIEAEEFQSMTYGWEIGEDARASGGRYIHMKEGVGDYESEESIEADPTRRSGDFYNISGDRRRIEARCWFTAPRGGRYFVAARTMANRRYCSNITYVVLNGARYEAGRNGSMPLVWLWHRVAEVRLKKGPNSLSFMAHQDGVKVDQVILTRSFPAGFERRTFSGGCRLRPALPDGMPPANVSLGTDTLAVTDERFPQISAYVHKNVPGILDARLDLVLEISGRRRLVLRSELLRRVATETSREVRLTDSDELVKVVWRPFTPEGPPRPLPRREYLVRCRLHVGGGEIDGRTAALFRGYDWSVLGPLPYMRVGRTGPPEKGLRPKGAYRVAGRTLGWKAYSEEFTDHFGLMDFGRMFSQRTFHAVRRATLYAYTEVRAPEGGEYRLKAQGDDDLIVWVNGKRAVTIAEKGPPIRTAREARIRLEAGRNRILFRLNQTQGQWQAGIRIRTREDRLADVVGIPFADQDVDFPEAPSQADRKTR